MPVTLREIARESGVSATVASLVLNSKGQRFRPETRRRVLRVARKLHYRPNASARSVATGRFGCIALLLSTNRFYSNLPPSLLDGVQHELGRRDMHLTIAQLPDERLTSDGVVPKILREWFSDGLLINYHFHIPEQMIGLIRSHEVPSVWINAKMPADCVYPDDFGAGRHVAEHMIGLGHRRIAYVDYSHGEASMAGAHYSAADRCAGYDRAMRQAGLAPRVIRGEGLSVPYVERQAYTAAWLGGDARPTAVISYGADGIGVVAVAAAAAGLDVPRDLTLATFSDRAEHFLGGTIATVLVPQFETGREAVRMLLRKIDEPGRALQSKKVAFEFDPGTTCAPPRGDGQG